MKKYFVILSSFLLFMSAILLAEEAKPATQSPSKTNGDLVTQEQMDVKRKISEIERGLSALERRLSYMDDKIDRIDRDVKDLKNR